MPNYVRNIFIEVSDEEKYKKFVLNDEGKIDFNILIPMPVSLSIGYSGLQDFNVDAKFFKFALNSHTFDDYRELIHDCMKINIPAFKKYEDFLNIKDIDAKRLIKKVYTVWNKVKLGYPSWYEWRTDKWGTKWNACEDNLSYPSIAQEYIFKTAWSTPSSWLSKLAEKLDFVLLYADEDIGCNCGIIEARNGVLVFHDDTSSRDPSTVFACAVHGNEIYDESLESPEEVEESKYLYDNKDQLLFEFFVDNDCVDIYNRNESKLNELFID